MAITLLLSADGESALVKHPDGRIFTRAADGEEVLALDPADVLLVPDEGEEPEQFDYDTFARAGVTKWGQWRVVGPDDKPYPEFDGNGLPPMEFTTLPTGEPVFRVQ